MRISLVNVNKCSLTENFIYCAERNPNRLWKEYRNIQESSCPFCSVFNLKIQIHWPDKILFFANFTQKLLLIGNVSESNFFNPMVKLWADIPYKLPKVVIWKWSIIKLVWKLISWQIQKPLEWSPNFSVFASLDLQLY